MKILLKKLLRSIVRYVYWKVEAHVDDPGFEIILERIVLEVTARLDNDKGVGTKEHELH